MYRTKFFLLCRNAVRHNLPVFDDDQFQKKTTVSPIFYMWRYVIIRILILEKMLDFNCACSIQIIASKHTNHNLWKPSVHTFLFMSCFLSLSIQTAVKLSEWVSFSQALLRLYRVQLMRKRRQSFGGASFRRNSCSRIDRNLIPRWRSVLRVSVCCNQVL